MSEPRWLNEDEMAFWRGFLQSANTVLSAIESDLRADAGIGHDDYEVLVLLSEVDNHRMRMSELSRRLTHSRSRLTQRIDRMITRGHVRREPCPDDKRGTLAVLTDEGLACIERAAPQHVESVRAVLIDRLTPEQLRAGREIFDQLLAEDN